MHCTLTMPALRWQIKINGLSVKMAHLWQAQLATRSVTVEAQRTL